MNINIDITSSLLIKLMEVLEKSVIGGLRPWQIKRVANAEAIAEQSRTFILTDTTRQIEYLKSGKKYYDAQHNKLLPTDGLDLSTEQRITSNEYVKILCKSQNVANAIKIAVALLEQEQENITPQEDVNQDWVNEWGEHAGFISDNDMQKLWGKVLAGEVKKPGSFSLRTMQFLRNLSTEEANLIHKYLKYNIHGSIFKDIIGYTDLHNLSLNNIIKLTELGVFVSDISGVLNTKITTCKASNNKNMNIQVYYSWKLITISELENFSIGLPIIGLTQIALELAQLGDYGGDENYLESIGKKILLRNNKSGVDNANKLLHIAAYKTIQIFV